eukprot:872389-Pyramimonas_sp.AAC.1
MPYLLTHPLLGRLTRVQSSSPSPQPCPQCSSLRLPIQRSVTIRELILPQYPNPLPVHLRTAASAPNLGTNRSPS